MAGVCIASRLNPGRNWGVGGPPHSLCLLLPSRPFPAPSYPLPQCPFPLLTLSPSEQAGPLPRAGGRDWLRSRRHAAAHLLAVLHLLPLHQVWEGCVSVNMCVGWGRSGDAIAFPAGASIGSLLSQSSDRKSKANPPCLFEGGPPNGSAPPAVLTWECRTDALTSCCGSVFYCPSVYFTRLFEPPPPSPPTCYLL